MASSLVRAAWSFAEAVSSARRRPGTPGFRQAAGRGALKARQRLDRIELAQEKFYRFGDRGGQIVAIDRCRNRQPDGPPAGRL